MTAREHLTMPDDPEWNATVDEILAEHRAEVLEEAAGMVLERFPDPDPAWPVFRPHVSRQISDELFRMAAESYGGTDE